MALWPPTHKTNPEDAEIKHVQKLWGPKQNTKKQNLGKDKLAMAMATDAQTQQIQTTQKSQHLQILWAPKHNTKAEPGNTMAMVTGARNESRRRRNHNRYKTCAHLSTTYNTEPGKDQICDCYGHIHTKQIQMTQKSKHLQNLPAPKHNTETEPWKGKICDGYGHWRTK